MASKPYPLKKSSSFREVAVNAKKIRLSSWVTVQIMPSNDSKNYFGITVSRKVANSVIRNKLKRWVRNCVQSESWPEKYNSCILVFVFKPQADAEFFSKLQYKEFKELFPGFKANDAGRFAILFYQATASFFLGGNCRYYPSCSHYGLEAFSRYGFFEAFKLTFLRISSCHPFSKKAFFDPVPTHYLEKSSK